MPVDTLRRRHRPPEAAPPAETRASDADDARRECAIMAVVVSASVVLSLFLLWYLDMFSSGAWEGQMDHRVRFIHGADDFAAAIGAPTPDGTANERAAFVAFYSQTCPHCKKLRSPYMHCSNRFEELLFLAVNVSDAENRKFALRFGIESIPKLYFIPQHSTQAQDKILYKGPSRVNPLAQFVQRCVSS